MKLLFILIWISTLSYAAENREHSLPECLELARKNSLQMIQGILNESYSQASYQETARNLLPQLFVQGRWAKSNLAPDQLSDANRAVIRVEQRLNPFSSIWKIADQRKMLWEASTEAKVESWQDVSLVVQKYYFSILRLRDAIERLNEVEKLLQKLLNSVIPRFTIRRTPPFDLVKVKTAISDLSRDRWITQAQLKGEQSRLSQMIGLEANTELLLKPVPSLPKLPDLDQLQGKIGLNPTLKVLGNQVTASQLGVTAAKYSRFPELIGGLDYGYGAAIGGLASMGYEASIGIRLPLFDWGMISSQIAQQAFTSELFNNRLHQEHQRIQSEVYQTHAEAIAHLADQSRLQELLPEVHQTAIASIERYRSGGAAILETTDAISLWFQTLLNERLAFYAYLADIAQLNRLTGVDHVEL